MKCEKKNHKCKETCGLDFEGYCLQAIMDEAQKAWIDGIVLTREDLQGYERI